MKERETKLLYDGISGIRDDFIEEARTAPLKKPFPVYRVAGIAAALAVAVGLGAAWLLRGSDRQLDGETERELGKADIATAPGVGSEDDTRGGLEKEPMGWYQITDGEFVESIGYPRLSFADASSLPTVALDYTLCPPDGSERELTAGEVGELLGQRFLEHLGLPEDTEVRGTLYFTADRVPCGAWIRLDAGDRSVNIEALAGHPVPSCVVFPDDSYGVTSYQGTDVRTLTDFSDFCEVSFLLNGTGWKATIRGENYEELASRFVRLAVDDLNAGLESARWENAPDQ